eukprot:TRINITY_DN43125_c0_g1_i1.p1 TRINITY_DN43125_c0_g1~~TRINITY_DN43125_c0_g1_i1.p1  ORF type:complete len:354 (+),score=127.68 TRINITY_DN43125_c0_g1_i1:66-1127(+)
MALELFWSSAFTSNGHVEVDPMGTVRDLKKAISEGGGPPWQRQDVLHSGALLDDDDELLADLGVCAETRVDVRIRERRRVVDVFDDMVALAMADGEVVTVRNGGDVAAGPVFEEIPVDVCLFRAVGWGLMGAAALPSGQLYVWQHSLPAEKRLVMEGVRTVRRRGEGGVTVLHRDGRLTEQKFSMEHGLVADGVPSPAVKKRHQKRKFFTNLGSHAACTTEGKCYVWGQLAPKVKPSAAAVAGSASSEHAVVLLEDGSIECFGNNDYGQAESRGFLYRKAIEVLAMGTASFALLDDGDVVSWGKCTALPDFQQPVVSMSASGTFAVAVLEGGNVLFWGDCKQPMLQGRCVAKP